MEDLMKKLLYRDIGRVMIEHHNNSNFDYNKVVQTNALKVLKDIKIVLKNNDLDDFIKIDHIINIFIYHNIDFGECHDFS